MEDSAHRQDAAGPDVAVHPVFFWLVVAFFVKEYARPPVPYLQGILVLVLPLLWLWSRDRPWSPILTCQVLILGTGIAMAPIADDAETVLKSSWELYGGVASAIAILWVMRDPRNLRRMLGIWLGILCFQALYALTHGGKGHGQEGFLTDENDLALGCVAVFPLALVGFKDLRGWPRWACGAAGLVLIAAVVASFSRGGLIGLLGASAYCVWFSRNRVRALLLGAGVAVLLFFAIPADYREELETIGETTTGTAEMRLFLWTTGTSIWLDHPLLGVGPNISRRKVSAYRPEPTESGLFSGHLYQHYNWNGYPLHSLYFDILADRGLLGIGLFGALLWISYRTLGRIRRRYAGHLAASQAIALGGALTGVLVCGLFLTIGNYPYLWHLTALVAALASRVNYVSKVYTPLS